MAETTVSTSSPAEQLGRRDRVVALAELPPAVAAAQAEWHEIAMIGRPDANGLRGRLLRWMLTMRSHGYLEWQHLTDAGRRASGDWALPPEQRLPPAQRFGLKRCNDLVQRSAAAELERLGRGEAAPPPRRPVHAAVAALREARLDELRRGAVVVTLGADALQRALEARRAAGARP